MITRESEENVIKSVIADPADGFLRKTVRLALKNTRAEDAVDQDVSRLQGE
jgi:hypothetical protein